MTHRKKWIYMKGFTQTLLLSYLRVQLLRHQFLKSGCIETNLNNRMLGSHQEWWTHDSLYTITKHQTSYNHYYFKPRYGIEKETISKFEKNANGILDDVSTNKKIIIDKGERHEDCVCNLFRVILSGPNSTFNDFIEITNYDWETWS